VVVSRKGAAPRLQEPTVALYYEVYRSRLQAVRSEAVSISDKLTRKEAELLDRLTREYGFISKSEAIRSAVRFYLNLLELRSRDRLRMLQLINELIAPSPRSSSELVEEGHREEDAI
jgi:metal-responsive CopG/Arc/MetJ family transcriptional regulator